MSKWLLLTLLLLSACISDEGCEAEPYRTIMIPPGPPERDGGADAR